jgi:hypothetical protein
MVYLRILRRLEGLDYEEFDDLLHTIASVADEWDDKLRTSFLTQARGARPRARPCAAGAPAAARRRHLEAQLEPVRRACVAERSAHSTTATPSWRKTSSRPRPRARPRAQPVEVGVKQGSSGRPRRCG